MSDLPAINWEYSEDGNSVRATSDLNDYVHDVMRGFHAKLDATLAAEIIPVLERSGYLAAHDAEVREGVARELIAEIDASPAILWRGKGGVKERLLAYITRNQGPALDEGESGD